MELQRQTRTALRAGGALLGLGMIAFTAHVVLGLGGTALDGLFNAWLYNGLLVGAAGACLTRVLLVPTERAPWLLLGVGLASWTAGDIYYTVALSDLESPPFPSVSDAAYLALYPASYFALILLLRSRISSFPRSLWLDGAIAASAVAAVAAALVFTPILESTEGDAAAVATNLAYPAGDLLLLALVVVVCGFSGWRPGRAWVLFAAGLALMSVADTIYLFRVAKETYAEGSLPDVLWAGSLLLVGLAAWQPPRRSAVRIDGWPMVAVPVLSGLAAVALLAYDHFARLNDVALALATATMVLVIVRMAMAFLENLRMLGRSRREASTDALTGLGNRRKLMSDLAEALRTVMPEDALALLLFDLDGFKQYNDSFGHVAGDALLARLGRSLAGSIGSHGAVYRLGGDEFCALVRTDSLGADAIAAGAVAALSEHGEGFSIGSSLGAALLPSEADEPSDALLLADRRMYAQKGGRWSSASRQARDVLLTTLRERKPHLHAHLQNVADLALRVGRRLGMPGERLDELARAAELHDVGKVAIPDAILEKPAPLSDEEWTFVRRHPIIGERILDAAPALRPVAALVRSSHERHDGGGYPDGLAGDEIPLGARIIAACDAYHAMTSERPYSPAMSRAGAAGELRRCAGSQFDPAVVEVLCEEVEGELAAAKAAGVDAPHQSPTPGRAAVRRA